ncbi:efflux RND transporter periplasmic adaptor subunit [candidate division KSB1 bacterium]|nr:efflux RND transporter periplasmic adaptor subunit [candidate division KSB1 bacterium]
MSKRKKTFIIIGIIIIIAIFMIFNLMKSKGGEIEVQVDEVKASDIVQTVSGSGKIRPEVEVDITANVSAEIIRLNVKEGDIVKKGDLLVELDRYKYEASVQQARSNLKSAQASLQKSKSEYLRVIDLFGQNLVSQAEKESAEASMLLAESNVEQAQATVEQAEDDLRKTRLYSPIDGTVTVLNKEQGEIALGSMFQSDVIMVVADLSRMEVLSEIDENDVVLVSINDTTNIEVDALPDTVLKGVVSEIAHSATTRGYGTQDEVTNFEVKIAIIDPLPKLRPGMSATVDIETEKHHGVLTVPIQSVTLKAESEIEMLKDKVPADSSVSESKSNPENGEPSTEKQMKEVVFVVEGNAVKIVPVETGISDDRNIEIVNGLEKGMKVVTGTYRAISKLLKDGSLVKIKSQPK